MQISFWNNPFYKLRQNIILNRLKSDKSVFLDIRNLKNYEGLSKLINFL